MKAAASGGTRQRTRRAILEAMVDVIMETDGIGFSVQAVADRAGVTHRTIYNHFPTREALCDAFSDYVDELLGASSGAQSPPGRWPRSRCSWRTCIGRWRCATATPAPT